MASSSNSFTAGMKGHSTNRPPLFDETNYQFWNNRMSVYMRSCDYEMWDVIMDGPMCLQRPKEKMENWNQSFETNGRTLKRKSTNKLQSYKYFALCFKSYEI